MKKLLAFFILLAVPLLALAGEGDYEMPADVYNALVYTSKSPTNIQNISSKNKKKVELVQGLIFVQIGNQYCRPCIEMVKFLQAEGIIDNWQESGVRFFKINNITEREKYDTSSVKLTDLWGVKKIPHLMVLKDGKEVAHKVGFSSNNSQEFLNKIQELTKAYK